MSSDRGDRAIGTAPGALSSAGAARRDEMLGELLGSMRRLHRRRRAARRAIAMTILFALVAGLSVLARPPLPAKEAPIEAAAGASALAPPAVSRRGVEIEIVRTDASVLERLATSPGSRATAVDDQALLGDLAAMNRPAGLIRMGGRVWLTGQVTDPVGEEPRAPPPS